MTVNEAMFRAAGNMILAFPENWDQRHWCNVDADVPQEEGDEEESNEGERAKKSFCGTTFCLNGWGSYLAGYTKANGKLTKQGRDWHSRYGVEGLRENGMMHNVDWYSMGMQVFGLQDWRYDQIEELFLAGTRTDGYMPAHLMAFIKDRTGVVVAPQATLTEQGNKVNVPFLRAVVAMIEAYPENWEQTSWCHVRSAEDAADEDGKPLNLCGTKFCVAGWAVKMAGLVTYGGKLSKIGKLSFQSSIDSRENERPTTSPRLSDWVLREMRFALQEGKMTDELWPFLASELLGVPDAVFGGGYAKTVEGLKERLTFELGITF